MAATREAPDRESVPLEKSSGDYSSSGRAVRAEIDLSAITANTRAVKELVGPRCGVMAVVKANGYGLGAPWVAGAALEGGAAWLAVACVDEGVQLRRAGYTGRLLVLGYVADDEAENAVRNNLTVTVHRAQTARALDRAANNLGLPARCVPVHIKVDTGLGRFGCALDEFLPLVEDASRLRSLQLEGVMTHFANADNENLMFAREQLARFNGMRKAAAQMGFEFEIAHAANSAATLGLAEARLDMVRVGIMLSGNLPAPHLSSRITLQRALTLRTRLSRVFGVQAGDSVGYGRTWVADAASLIGLVPVGYADGYSRVLSNRAQALVGGQRCPVVGRVSMDQTAIDITGVSAVREGDEVVLIGRQVSDEITPGEVADWAGTISYEVLCGLTARVPRHYTRDGEVVAACDLLGSSADGTPFHLAKEKGR
jgi:alanine racemase